MQGLTIGCGAFNSIHNDVFLYTFLSQFPGYVFNQKVEIGSFEKLHYKVDHHEVYLAAVHRFQRFSQKKKTPKKGRGPNLSSLLVSPGPLRCRTAARPVSHEPLPAQR